MQVILDGTQMTQRALAHAHLKQQLQLPDYYGRNLDALYDLLTERSEATCICLRHSVQMLSALGIYGQRLMDTMVDAAEQNPLITIITE